MRTLVEKKTPLILNKVISVLLGSSIVKDTAYMFSSKIGAALLGVLGSIIVIRELGPFNFGLYATAVAFVPLLTVIFDFGLTTTMIKFGSLYLKKDKKRANILFKIIGKQKIIIIVTIGVVGLLLSKFIAIKLYNKPELVFPLRISMLCIMINTIYMYMETILHTRQQFSRSAMISFSTSLVKFGSILILYFMFHLLILKSMLLLLLGVFLFSMFFCSFFVNKEFLFTKYTRDEGRMVLKDLFGFSKWVMVSTLCFPLARRLDIVMLNYYVDSSMVGKYACALQLIAPLMMLKGSLHSVLLPRVSKITSYNGYMNYAKKFTALIGVFCFSFVPIIFFAQPIIEAVFGERYSQSAYIFQILVVKMIFMLILNPLHMIAYSAGHPWIISIKDIVALFINIVANIILIPLLGIPGAAYGTLLTTVIGGIIPVIYIYFRILSPLRGFETPAQKVVMPIYNDEPF